MRLIKRTIFFLKYNWGGAFILAFMVLIIASAVYLNFRFTEESNQLASLGFYSLIFGIILQIASNLVFGNKKYSVDPTTQYQTDFKFPRKYKILGAVCIIVIISFASVLILYPTSVTPIIQNLVTSSTESTASFHASIFFANVIPEPENQTLLAFGVNANGAPAPYIFKVMWSDGFTQTNDVGTFSRTISSGQLIPTFATVTITSANNKSISITVLTPATNTTVTTSNFRNASTLTFLEYGLLNHNNWSVGLNASERSSSNNSIVFENLKNGIYNFSVNYQFNGSLDSVYSYSPPAGKVLINGTDEVQRINFTIIPVDEIVTPTSAANVSVSNNVITLMVNYRSSLPMSMAATVVAVVNDSSGRLITISTATLDVGANLTAPAKILLESLTPGKYSATLYVIYEN